jgi:hypothetical protein
MFFILKYGIVKDRFYNVALMSFSYVYFIYLTPVLLLS